MLSLARTHAPSLSFKFSRGVIGPRSNALGARFRSARRAGVCIVGRVSFIGRGGETKREEKARG